MAKGNGLLVLNPIAREEVSFVQNYITQFDEWRKKSKERSLRPNDVVLFHNTSWTILRLVWRPMDVSTREDGRGVDTEALRCMDIRPRRGSISPWMIQHYAMKNGIDLGLPSFEKYYHRNRKEKAA